MSFLIIFTFSFTSSTVGADSSAITETSANIAAVKQIQCVPLWSILKVLKKTVVDYFSLDIEGMEMRVSLLPHKTSKK